ncbi:MAG: DEAD/DEAH box helicase [Mesorhizobium sp.]|uniref:DEAD/DEAH box helicase n=1 Tax=Mesorhizobium sp. TaxID=1871066 RepID=UPI00122B3D68|nr:DEAD/DEAH box helicase [Mesorhizobium sp.]TIM41783.1 MAG: DEAD/DEAH box helicase [Mesorhizobium sp.]
MAFVLRPYQQELIVEARDALREVNSVLVQMATGGGKTGLAAFMASSAAKRGKRVVFGVHRRELIKQTALTFDKVGIPYGIIASGMTGDRRQPVQIASIQTLGKRMDMYGAPDLYVPDEAHHAGAKSWADIIEEYAGKKSKIVGLSATPERMDGTGLGKWFGRMVTGPSPAWLMEQGYLATYRMFAPTSPDLGGVKRTGGDFNKAELEKRMGATAITGNAVEHYRRLAHGRKAMIFCVSIKHSLSVVAQFQAAGYTAAHIDGDSPDRDAILRAYERGTIQILSSVDLVSEGFDLPAIEVAILLRPTHSLPLFLQQVGRVLRPVYAPGFDLDTQAGRLMAIAAGPKPYALILDHAGNSIPKDQGGRGHGLPDDDRDWTLEGHKKKKRAKDEDEDDEPAVTTRQCPNCFRVHQPAPVCPQCQHVYPTMGRTVKELAGELAEIDRTARVVAKQEQSSAKSLEDLVALGKMRGMKNPHGWAKHVHAARMAKSQTRYVR